jgi:2-amino-4-hydroxy-6-hydroxymethyldihydropteridine diphosphokinase
MPAVFLSLGSNLGDREKSISLMEQELLHRLGQPVQKSPVMETEPLGMKDNTPWFLNRILRGEYMGTPDSLLTECRDIEKKLGRGIHKPLTSRSADIDILLFGDSVMESADLTIPHPAILMRRFCIEGLLCLAPDLVFPGTGKTIAELAIHMDALVRSQQVRFQA